MQLQMERTYRILLGETDSLRVLLVGVGGTGSALALALGRLAYHLQQKGIRVELTLVDPDTVEEKNIGRQCFCPAEVGQNKAETLALRLNAALGLDSLALPKPFDHRMLAGWWSPWSGRPPANSLLIGAVDNHVARRALAQAVMEATGRLWCLDLGNARDHGQLLLGNLGRVQQLASIELSALGLCSGLPSPYLQAPELLQPAQVEPDVSCADLVLREEQSLVVNQAVAALAAQYCQAFMIQRELTAFATTFTLVPPTAVTQTITEASLARLARTIQGCGSEFGSTGVE
jgi:PRTRC genetic system ThiF family protein